MPSQAYVEWTTSRAAALDEIERAHQSIGGTGPGRRYATQQINHAYAVLLSSHFQGFCRDLHTECVEHLIRAVASTVLQPIMRHGLEQGRKLDHGNPNPDNIEADFGRLAAGFWAKVEANDARNVNRRLLLSELNRWRNAIAHQDFDPNRLGGTTVLRLRRVRDWRHACDRLAESFDAVLFARLADLTGNTPW